MTSGVWLILGGGLIGAGLFVGVYAALPPAPVNLTASLRALGVLDPPGPLPIASDPSVPGLRGAWDRLVGQVTARLAHRPAWLGATRPDLALVGSSPTRLVSERLTLALVGLLTPTVLWVITAILGDGLPVSIPFVLGLAAAVGLSLIPPMRVRERAGRAREEFRRGLSAYLDLVAQDRASGRGPDQALTEAALVGQGWVFTRIRDTLSQARVAGITGWRGLAELADRVGVPELTDLADIIATAADGAAVHATLSARATSLREAAIAADHAQANSRSERLVFPLTLLGAGFLLLLIYPAVTRLLTG